MNCLPTGTLTNDQRLTAWEMVHQLIRALEAGGEGAAAALVAKLGSKAEIARELAYRLYTLCERKKRAAEALSYNGLVQSWPEISRLARDSSKPPRNSKAHYLKERGVTYGHHQPRTCRQGAGTSEETGLRPFVEREMKASIYKDGSQSRRQSLSSGDDRLNAKKPIPNGTLPVLLKLMWESVERCFP